MVKEKGSLYFFLISARFPNNFAKYSCHSIANSLLSIVWPKKKQISKVKNWIEVIKSHLAIIKLILLTGKRIVSQLLPHRPSRTTKKALAGSPTPHCSFPTLRSWPVSRSALDDGAPSFRAKGVLRVRVGRRPGSSISAGFCSLVQEDKWTFDTNTGPILLKTKMFAVFYPLELPHRRQDAANLSWLQKGKGLTERDHVLKFSVFFRTLHSKQKLSK